MLCHWVTCLQIGVARAFKSLAARYLNRTHGCTKAGDPGCFVIPHESWPASQRHLQQWLKLPLRPQSDERTVHRRRLDNDRLHLPIRVVVDEDALHRRSSHCHPQDERARFHLATGECMMNYCVRGRNRRPSRTESAWIAAIHLRWTAGPTYVRHVQPQPTYAKSAVVTHVCDVLAGGLQI